MKKGSRLSVIFFLALVAPVFIAAQENAGAQETESTVPELVAYHDIIYPIWHTAYPEKDYNALRSYAPEIKNQAEKIYGASLPGILRDKEAKWKQGLAEFKKAVDDYVAAAASPGDEALLKAAEGLHAKYEILVRTIRPVLKEVDAFHKVLYVIYHEYLPHKDYEKIKASSEDLMFKAEAITKATLPGRLDSRKAQFEIAAAELYEATKALGETAKTDGGEAFSAAVEKMHAKYQSLVNVFD